MSEDKAKKSEPKAKKTEPVYIYDQLDQCHLPSFLFVSLHSPHPLSLSLPPSLHLLSTDRPSVSLAQPGYVNVSLGGTLQISCTYDGVPPPNTVFWKQNLTTINSVFDHTYTVKYNNTATTLIGTHMPAYGGGSYDCVARNVLGESQNRTIVQVFCEWWRYDSERVLV